ncbi:uncharacterized protein LOC110465865 [Mizuhopecten yessoensis]|uniref:Uncharacterized protein n=1 Tax=Mizuhopecten yessoensis TaxID=6573 RepID=A0A210PQP4_MIZYE|nr:uncharacterized protein LOC110465865 [Mizuhopecten yessoensis]OWF38801.1 hypothetical protein KP79_PYT16684 [Mizuhopecten yessoensis]
MSFIFGRHKERDAGKTHKFYVEFLGWIECQALRGRKYTDPVVNDLRRKQRKWRNAPKLTLQVSKKEMKISQDMEEKKRKIRTVKFPNIPSRDITYVTQATDPSTGRPDDIVACIYLGFVPRTQKYVHVHVYRFDTPETASNFVRIMHHIISGHADRVRQIEQDLASRGWIDDTRLNRSDGLSDPHTSDSAPDSGASTYSGDDDTLPSDEIEPDLQSLKDVMAFDSVTDELKQRLNLGPAKKPTGPILLPPKDYDTISRRQGNLDKVDLRKSLNINIVGQVASPRHRNGSNESGVDLNSPSDDSDDGKIVEPVSPSEEAKSSPPLSARDMVYPPRNANGLNESFQRHSPNRQQSFNSAYSSNSYRSGSSNNSNGLRDSMNNSDGSFRVYKGTTDIPAADYDNEPVIMRRENQWRSTDMGRSVAFAQDYPGMRRITAPQMTVHEEDGPMYAVVNKQRPRSTRDIHIHEGYSPRPGDFRVRRTVSMYNK